MSEPGRKTAVFLSVRDKATRLPGKVLADICGRPAIVHLIERLKTARRPDLLVMATSGHRGDDALADIAAAQGIACFRGSEADKLQRYLDAANKYGVDFIAVVDGDDLFCDVDSIDRIIDDYMSTNADYIICDGLPVGATAFGVRVAALRKVIEIKDEHDTEVWGGYFTESDLFQTRALPVSEQRYARPDLRMTLDYPEDLMFFRAVFEALYAPGKNISFQRVMKFLEERPDVAAINAGCRDTYAASLRTAAAVRFKPHRPVAQTERGAA